MLLLYLPHRVSLNSSEFSFITGVCRVVTDYNGFSVYCCIHQRHTVVAIMSVIIVVQQIYNAIEVSPLVPEMLVSFYVNEIYVSNLETRSSAVVKRPCDCCVHGSVLAKT